MSSEAGVAYVDVQGRFDSLNAGIDAALANIGARFGAIGGVAVAGIGLIAGAAVGAAAGLYAIGDSFDDAYDTIRVRTGATGDLLEGLKDDFRAVVQDVPTDFGTAADAIGQIHQRLDLTGAPLQRIAAQFLELSRLTGTDLSGNIETVTRLFGDWAIPTERQAGALDRLFRASQASGVSVDTLGQLMVRYGAPLRQLGFSFDEAAAMVAKFQKEGVNTELVMGSLRIALGKMARDGEPAIETFRRAVDEIKNAGDASTANSLALELFGARAGPDMAAAIREGRFSIDELVGTISNGSDTIMAASADTEDFSEKFTKLKNKLLVELEPAATWVFDQLAIGMDKLPAAVDALEDFFGPIVADVEAAWPRIEAAITDIVDAITVIWDEFGDEILSVAEASWDQIISMIEGPLEVISGLFDIFAGIIEGDWSRVWDGLKSIVEGVWMQITGIVEAAWSVIESVLSIAGTIALQILDGAWQAIRGGAEAAWAAVTGAVSAGVDATLSFIGSLPGRILGFLGSIAGAGLALGASLIDGLWNGIKNAAGKIGDVAGAILEAFKRGWNSAARAINDFIPNEIGFDTPLGFIGVNLPDNPLPTFHTGDIVPGPPGREVPLKALAGEGIFTPAQMAALAPVTAAGGGQIIINGDVYGYDDFQRKVAQATIGAGQAGDLEPIGIAAGRRG